MGLDADGAGSPPTRGRSRTRLAVAIAAAVAVVALAGIGTAVVAGAREAVTRAEALAAAVTSVQADVGAGALDSLPADLQAVAGAAQNLQSTTQTWQWGLLSNVPGLGPTTEAVSDLAWATETLADAATPLAAAAEAAPSTASLIRDLPALEPAVRDLQITAQEISEQLSAIDAAQLRFGLAEQVTAAAEQAAAIEQVTMSALDAWPALSGLLGFEGPRTYLVMLQNPAEARGSGGLFSAFMRVAIDEGVLTIEEANTRKVLDDSRIPVPADIDPGEREMWGDYLTRWASFNTSPDFPTTARLAQAGMAARGTPVDGVLAIDPYAVEAMLQGTGPVEHQGVTIDGTNAADFFTKAIYTDYPSFADVAAKDELALGLLFATVDSALTRPLDLAALTDTVPAAIDQGHLKAWVPNTQEQRWLAETGLAHDVATVNPGQPILALNNATSGKLDAYVTKDVRYDAGVCVIGDGDLAGWTRSTYAVTLTNNAPTDLPDYVDLRLDKPDAPRGSTTVLVTVLGPNQAVEEAVATDGELADYVSGQAHARPYWLGQVELARDQASDLTITWAEPPITDGAGVTTPCSSTVR